MARTNASRALAVAIGVAAATTILLLRHYRALPAAGALLLVVGLIVLAPVSRELSGRIFLLGLALLGWPFLLWQPLWTFDRTGATLAVAAAVVVYTVVRRRQSSKPVLPRVRVIDALVPVSAAAGVAALGPWLRARTPVDALATLLPGWDNSEHYDMWRMILLHGQTVDRLPNTADGAPWAYSTYPQGFHAVAATIADALWPGVAHDTGLSVVAYSRSMALVMILLVVVLTAGICRLAVATRHPMVSIPASALVSSALLLGPGGISLEYGFANFVLACGLLVGAVLVVLTMPRIHSSIELVALGGALIGIASNWGVLLVVAAPIAAAALLPLSRGHWSASPRQWLTTVAVGALTAMGVARPVAVVAVDPQPGLFTADGAISVPNLGTLVAVAAVVTALGAIMGMNARHRHDPMKVTFVRYALLSLGALAALMLVAVYIARLQLAANGRLGYYEWKLLTAGLILLTGLLATGLVVAASLHPDTLHIGVAGPARFSVAVGLAVAATQVFGYSGPTSRAHALTVANSPAELRAQWDAARGARVGAATELLAATRASVGARGFEVAYLAVPGPATMDPINAQQWFLALRATWTRDNNSDSRNLAMGQDSVAATAQVAAKWLTIHPHGTLVVAPEVAETVTRAVPSAATLSW